MNDELQQASRRLSGLTQRRPGLALGLWGEPGIGKTHAALSLLHAFPGRSWTVHATQTLSSVASMLPRPRKPTLWLERSLERLARGEQAEAAVGAQTLAALLSAAAPMLLHVEDLHEASDEGLAFWTQVAGIVNHTRSVGLIVTGRAAPPEGFEALRLSPLNREASDALLEAEVGAALPKEALAWVFERARGNPLYTLEFFRYLSRQGFAWNDGHRWRWRVPEREVMPLTVEGVIERMLHDTASTPALEQAIQAKAVLMLGASEAFWAEVSGLNPQELAQARGELERQGVLSEGEFAHPLYREVIVQNLSSAQRRGLAQRALKALQSDPRTAALFIENAALEPRQALEWLERATDASTKAGNEVEAARFKAKAVEYTSGDERTRLALEAARVLLRIDIPESLRLTEFAVLNDPENSEAIELSAVITAGKGLLAEAKHLYERIPPQKRSMDRIIVLYALAGDYTGALELWRSHPEVWQTSDAQVLYQIAFTLSSVGDQDEAMKILERSQNRPDLTPEQRWKLVYIQATIEYRLSNYTKQEMLSGEALDLARLSAQPQAIAHTLFLRHYALGLLGRFQEALEALNEARTRYAEVGDIRNYASTLTYIAALETEFGRYERAEELLLEAQDTLARLNQSGGMVDSGMVDCEKALADLYASWNIPHAQILCMKHAQNTLWAARTLNNPQQIITGLLTVSNAESKQGHSERGLVLALEALALAETQKSPWGIFEARTHLAQALGKQGRIDEAIEVYDIARELAEQLGLTTEAQSVGLEVDHLRGDTANIASRLAFFEARGLTNTANRAREYFETHAGTVVTPVSPKLKPEGFFRLEVLGPMQLRKAGVSTPLRGGKRKELLALLLEARIRGRSEVAALDLCDALYPLEPEEAALGALRAAVFKIRSSLGAALVTTTPNGYALGLVASDAEAFLHDGDTNLWRGLYLEDLMLEGRDENVCDALNKALRTRIEALIEDVPTNLEEAVRLSHLLVRAEPYDLGTLTVACRVLLASRNRRTLDRLYSKARTRMLEVGEALPEGSAAFLEMHASPSALGVV